MSADVIMIMFNPSPVAVDSIKSLLTHSEGVNRIIVIDNCSENKTNIFRIFGMVDLHITLKQQVSLAHAWNIGLEYANTDYAVVTNDDILFTENWLPPLIKGMDENEKIGVIQPYNTLSKLPADFPNNYVKEERIGEVPKDNFVGCCFMVRRNILPRLKEYDKRRWPDDWEDYTYFYNPYYPIGAEDQDFLLRIKNAGYEVKTAFDSYVHHYSAGTTGKIPDFEDIKERNNQLFIKRWDGAPVYFNFKDDDETA